MKLIINRCYGGFSVRKDIKEKLGLNSMSLDDIRCNPKLIALIESGEDVSTPYSELQVVNIPDNCTDYYVSEYDGLEDVIYVVDGKLKFA